MICKYEVENMKVYKYIMPVISSNMYILLVGETALVIDPNENEDAARLLREHGIVKVVIILTHEHYDHISGVNYFRKEWECIVYGNNHCKELVTSSFKNLSEFFMTMFIAKDEAIQKEAAKVFQDNYSCAVDIGFEGELIIEVGPLSICLIDTPGHSMGSICAIVNDKYLFSGDSLIPGEKTILRLPGSDKRLWRERTKPLLEKLNSNLIVFPGHGEEGIKNEMKVLP